METASKIITKEQRNIKRSTEIYNGLYSYN